MKFLNRFACSCAGVKFASDYAKVDAGLRVQPPSISGQWSHNFMVCCRPLLTSGKLIGIDKGSYQIVIFRLIVIRLLNSFFVNCYENLTKEINLIKNRVLISNVTYCFKLFVVFLH